MASGAVGGSGPTSGSGRSGRAPVVDMVIVVGLNTLTDGLAEGERDIVDVDVGGDLRLPVETLRRMACTANIIPAVMNTAGVIVDIGRTRRLANRAQRRALQAMYPTCAIPGCHVRYAHCQPHHIQSFRHGGSTDMDNLLPLCSTHHHRAHQGGWQLAIDPTTRILTVTLPNGTVMTNGPPHAQTA